MKSILPENLYYLLTREGIKKAHFELVEHEIKHEGRLTCKQYLERLLIFFIDFVQVRTLITA